MWFQLSSQEDKLKVVCVLNNNKNVISHCLVGIHAVDLSIVLRKRLYVKIWHLTPSDRLMEIPILEGEFHTRNGNVNDKCTPLDRSLHLWYVDMIGHASTYLRLDGFAVLGGN